MTFIIAMVLFAAIMTWAIRADGVDRKRWDAEFQADFAEAQKTKHVIQFEMADGIIRNTPIYEAKIWSRQLRIFSPSGLAAKEALKDFMKSGYIVDQSGNHYPTCNVKSAKVIRC